MSGPLRLRHRVGEAIAALGLWQPGERVAIAVSGGVDSVVLLDVLTETARWHGGALEVVTVDHGQHAESAAFAAFVAVLADGCGLRCTIAHAELAPGADEATARAARYAVFDRLDVDRVALAHHADDVAETVLVNLIRGTGLAGLAGIPRIRGRYVRPLLDEPRAAILAYASARGLRWRDDPTNADPRFLRNRLRAEVVPLLEAIRPGATRAIARTAAGVAADDAVLDAIVDAELGVTSDPPVSWPLSFVCEAPEPVVRRAFQRAVPGISAGAVAEIVGAAARGYGQVPASGHVLFRIEGASVSLVRSGTGTVGPDREATDPRETPLTPPADVTKAVT